MTDEQSPRALQARLAFTAQENVLHDQLMALNAEIAAARQRNPSPDQWEAALAHLVEVCNAIAHFRARWRELMGPE
jgi:hypothetical protein